MQSTLCRLVESLSWRLLAIFLLFSLLGCGRNLCVPNCVYDPLPPFYVPEKVRVALVLGSGGVRGTAHLGVIEELEAAGIYPDLIVGCSAGSIVGALYADKGCSKAIRNSVWQMRADSILEINLLSCRYGLSKRNALHKLLDRDLDACTFDQLKIPLVVVATDLYTGELVPMGGGDLVTAVESSASIPFVFVPCKHFGRILVDGGTINPVPARVARDLGAEVVIAVDLSELLPTTQPSNLFQIGSRSAEIAFMWQNESCTRAADVVIRPKTCGVGTFNDDMKMVLYRSGRRAAHEKIAQIQELIQQRCSQPTGYMRLVNLPCYTPALYREPS